MKEQITKKTEKKQNGIRTLPGPAHHAGSRERRSRNKRFIEDCHRQFEFSVVTR